MPGELNRIAVVEAFKELGEGVGTLMPNEENGIDKKQAEAEFLESGVKEIMFKENHKQIGIGRDYMGTHSSFLDLEIMLGVEGEMLMREDKLGKLDKVLEWMVRSGEGIC